MKMMVVFACLFWSTLASLPSWGGENYHNRRTNNRTNNGGEWTGHHRTDVEFILNLIGQSIPECRILFNKQSEKSRWKSVPLSKVEFIFLKNFTWIEKSEWIGANYTILSKTLGERTYFFLNDGSWVYVEDIWAVVLGD